jgi:hypothetical protein
MLTRRQPGEDFDGAGDACVEVFEVEVVWRVDAFGGQLAGLLVPADAVALVVVVPVVTEFEGVSSPAGIGVQEVLIAKIRGGLCVSVLAHGSGRRWWRGGWWSWARGPP